MQTRISKIARLPHNIREQLNHRLQNGENGPHPPRQMARTTNPETKTVMTEHFDGHAITHQNPSPNLATAPATRTGSCTNNASNGFGNWKNTKLRSIYHDQSTDTFEAMSNYFIFELGQAITSLVLREISKTRTKRTNRLETLTCELSPPQNAFNWSRRVGFSNSPNSTSWKRSPQARSNQTIPPSKLKPTTLPGSAPAPGRRRRALASHCCGLATSQDSNPLELREPEKTRTQNHNPKPAKPVPRTPEAVDERASVLDCGSPLPLSESTVRPNDNNFIEIHPNPAPAPTTPPPLNSQPILPPRPSKPHISPVPIRGLPPFACTEVLANPRHENEN